MKRFTLLTALSVVLLNSMTLDVHACNGGGYGGGGFGGGYGGGYSYSAPAPLYRPAPIRYAQPRYATQPTSFQRPVQSVPQIRVAPTQRLQTPQPQNNFAPQQLGMQQQGQAPQQQFQSQQVQQQSQQSQQAQTQQPQQFQQRQVQQQQSQQQVQPQQPQPQQQVRRTQPQPQTQNVGSSSQLSALQMLAGNQSDSAAPAPAPVQAENTAVQQPLHVGRWVAELPNRATVELTLQADGSFSWSANNGGKTSSFQGQFTMNGDTLTLNRVNDNQQLAGKLTLNGNSAFNFQLDGAKDSGLNFNRQG